MATGTDCPATSYSLRRIISGTPSSDFLAPSTDPWRNLSDVEPNLLQRQHYDVLSSSRASRAAALRRFSSEPELSQNQHYDVFSRSWAGGIPRAGSTSPRVQQLHREMLDVFEEAVEAEVLVQVPAVSPGSRRRYTMSPEPAGESADTQLRHLSKRKTAPREETTSAATALGTIRTIERAERNDASFLFIRGLSLFVVTWLSSIIVFILLIFLTLPLFI